MLRGCSGADAGRSGVQRAVQTLPTVMSIAPAHVGASGITSSHREGLLSDSDAILRD